MSKPSPLNTDERGKMWGSIITSLEVMEKHVGDKGELDDLGKLCNFSEFQICHLYDRIIKPTLQSYVVRMMGQVRWLTPVIPAL